jgi:hypothetical protein
MKSVLITGGSGLIGRALSELLLAEGYKVFWLSRTKNLSAKFPSYSWDYTKREIDTEILEEVDIIVHLAGDSIGSGRWTETKKEQIMSSRIDSTVLLLETLRELDLKPDVFISASAVGIYGNKTTENIYEEKDKTVADDFLAQVCNEWEKAVEQISKTLGSRTVMIRTSMVLSPESEAFKKMYLPTKFGLGASLGSGKQYMPWIHIQDLCRIYLKAIQDTTLNGAYNASSPQQLRNREFMNTLSRVLKKPKLLPFIPGFIIRMMMGEAAEMVLGGSRISSKKIQEKGFKFLYDNAEDAIRNCVEGIKNK